MGVEMKGNQSSSNSQLGDMDWLRQWARLSPAAIALEDGETRFGISYGELYEVSCHLAAKMTAQWGVRVGDRIAMLASTELEAVVLFMSSLRLGTTLVPVNFRLTAAEIEHVLEDSTPTLLVAQEHFAGTLSGVSPRAMPEHFWSFDGHGSLTEFVHNCLRDCRTRDSQTLDSTTTLRRSLRADSQPAWHQALACSDNEPCMILYTSGTTGKPKGAMITPKMLFWNSLNTTLRLNLSQSDVFVSFLPLFHTGGWNVLLTPFLHRGAKTVLLKKFDADRILSLCEEERATILFGVPTTMEMLARSPLFEKCDLSSVRYAIVGGEPMPIDLIHIWQKHRIPIRQGYGLTEFGPNVFSLNEEDSTRKIGSIGFPNFYIQSRVVDDQGRDVSQGEIGELLLKGPVCSPGYWNNEKATKETIVDGWLHTGDLVRYDEEGYFYVAGRKKEMFKSGGENVYPSEVERVLSQHPEIREVAVIGVPDAKWGEVGRAFVVPAAGVSLSAEQVIGFCADKLAKFKIPRQVSFLSELPKGDSGKILKRVLIEQHPAT